MPPAAMPARTLAAATVLAVIIAIATLTAGPAKAQAPEPVCKGTHSEMRDCIQSNIAHNSRWAHDAADGENPNGGRQRWVGNVTW